MNSKEEFLAFLKQASETVDKWPDWKKSGLNAPTRNSQSTHELVKAPHPGTFSLQSGNVK